MSIMISLVPAGMCKDKAPGASNKIIRGSGLGRGANKFVIAVWTPVLQFCALLA
jgi:hypothetical protein